MGEDFTQATDRFHIHNLPRGEGKWEPTTCNPISSILQGFHYPVVDYLSCPNAAAIFFINHHYFLIGQRYSQQKVIDTDLTTKIVGRLQEYMLNTMANHSFCMIVPSPINLVLLVACIESISWACGGKWMIKGRHDWPIGSAWLHPFGIQQRFSSTLLFFQWSRISLGKHVPARWQNIWKQQPAEYIIIVIKCHSKHLWFMMISLSSVYDSSWKRTYPSHLGLLVLTPCGG